MLTKDRVIMKVEERLNGLIGDEELRRWAVEKMEEDKLGIHVFDVRHRSAIYESVYRIVSMDAGPAFELSDREFHGLIARLMNCR
jgi:hypothetical protein